MNNKTTIKVRLPPVKLFRQATEGNADPLFVYNPPRALEPVD